MNPLSWAAWAAVLFFQNVSFTYVSRARSSGSILRHAKASVFSNGIWIFSQMIMLGPMFDYLTGKHGHGPQLAAAGVYTASCLGGSLFAHWFAMKTEKGKNAVGFNKKYAQIPVEQWEALKEQVAMLALVTPETEKPKAADHMLAGTLRVWHRSPGASWWDIATPIIFNSIEVANNWIREAARTGSLNETHVYQAFEGDPNG